MHTYCQVWLYCGNVLLKKQNRLNHQGIALAEEVATTTVATTFSFKQLKKGRVLCGSFCGLMLSGGGGQVVIRHALFHSTLVMWPNAAGPFQRVAFSRSRGDKDQCYLLGSFPLSDEGDS